MSVIGAAFAAETENIYEERAASYVIEAVEPRGGLFFRAVKRGFDIAASLVGGIVLIIPMLLLALAIRIDSKGPALFRQERLGKDGKSFNILKFRSMVLDAEANGPQWADIGDSRCTRLGYWLRRHRLDELPQLWNIFLGQMSFVGPRPERPYFYNEFESYIHGFSNRLAVKPGLTGLAQVYGGYELLPEEKIVYDMDYIKRQTLWLDFVCIIKTVGLVFTKEGAR